MASRAAEWPGWVCLAARSEKSAGHRCGFRRRLPDESLLGRRGRRKGNEAVAMQYLGGKSRLAKQIAEIVAPQGLWWEPFCGGLSVSVQLAKFGPGLVSDVNPALIALYQAVRGGWQPPETVSELDYQAARTLPDSSPLKAFCGFGCSFGGKWFGGFARQNSPHNFAAAAKRAVERDVAFLTDCDIECLSFFAIAPVRSELTTIYADPPYAGTTGYSAVGVFDHKAFWGRCQEWAACGVRVLVSEYSCPIPANVVWERSHYAKCAGGTKNDVNVEKLFEVLP